MQLGVGARDERVQVVRDRGVDELGTCPDEIAARPAVEFAQAPGRTEVERVELPDKTLFQRVLNDYASQRLSLKAHPVSFLRPWLDQRRAVSAASLQAEAQFPSGKRVVTAGLVLVRQRPMTARGIFFVTLEDETGIANLVIWPQVFERYRAAARHGAVILVNGRVDREGEVVHVIVERLESLDERMGKLAFTARSFH